ncbi:MAG: hypothetical protein E4H07_01955 [Nitrosomonadales bacterium]|nr:MAG: hypothetical protein E4H07_01955 [Nitrosomonadales bacterium]
MDEVAGPRSWDSPTIVWLYHSHLMGKEKINLGLIGTSVITKKGMESSNPFLRDVIYLIIHDLQ